MRFIYNRYKAESRLNIETFSQVTFKKLLLLVLISI